MSDAIARVSVPAGGACYTSQCPFSRKVITRGRQAYAVSLKRSAVQRMNLFTNQPPPTSGLVWKTDTCRVVPCTEAGHAVIPSQKCQGETRVFHFTDKNGPSACGNTPPAREKRNPLIHTFGYGLSPDITMSPTCQNATSTGTRYRPEEQHRRTGVRRKGLEEQGGPSPGLPAGGGHAYRSGIGHGVVRPVAAAPAAQRPERDGTSLRPTRTATRPGGGPRRPHPRCIPRTHALALTAPMSPVGSPVAPLC